MREDRAQNKTNDFRRVASTRCPNTIYPAEEVRAEEINLDLNVLIFIRPETTI